MKSQRQHRKLSSFPFWRPMQISNMASDKTKQKMIKRKKISCLVQSLGCDDP